MSVVIVGGNECMVRRYKDLCSQYNCSAKVIVKMNAGLRDLGQTDLLVLFTNTVSHKMVASALNGVKGQNTSIARCHSSSMSALKNILDEHVKMEGAN